MATPMTAAQWRSQAKKFNQPFVEKASFKDPLSGRDNETGLYFGPVYGGVFHHVGSDASDAVLDDLIGRGRSDLSGPLANTGCRDDGVLEFFTVGRANHAGKGDADVYRAVRTENYGDYPPKPNRDEIDGNDCLYGLENYYSGSKPPTAKSYRATVNWGAMICDFHDWTAKSLIGHKEWTYRKIDPGKIDMAKYRRDVDARIAEVNRALSPYDNDNIVKIMSWNAGQQSEAAILQQLREVLPKATPDIFCGQEFYRVDDFLSIPSYNFRYQVHAPCPEYPKYISEHPANMIVTRNTGVVKDKDAFEMDTPWRGPNLGLWHSPRIHRDVTYNTGSENIRVLDFHGLAVKTGREESLQAAEDWLREMKQLGPAVIVGDFNAKAPEVYEKIAKSNGATVDGAGIDLAVYVNMDKVRGENLGLHGSDHPMKMWTFRF